MRHETHCKSASVELHGASPPGIGPQSAMRAISSASHGKFGLRGSSVVVSGRFQDEGGGCLAVSRQGELAGRRVTGRRGLGSNA